ncbi:RluA family pseudouridine synthase [Commensalibacter oyaizuii]|uniref:Pseudouridine synthase n=1 Tax=Commensalibacter oyaizuii TaxID=3043873 RepID=A0ABT6PZJ3_9PROT|nr:RluA family pseudouridine synthase [Commensalibacter sp. TBRC 16381]MDI2090277.1 RluA family pseudouridine synthase [Commensalibacter sp. TBRC 16381]
MKILNITVQKEDGDVRVDRWVKRQNPNITQGIVQKLCRTGQIRVNGKRVQTSTHLTSGDNVRLPMVEIDQQLAKQPKSIDPKLAKEIKDWIIYQDNDLFVLNKPSGIAVQGGSNVTKHIDGLLEALQGESKYRPSLVHRLDKDTSGLLLIARHPASAAKLAAAFRSRDMKKIYWAITTRRPSPLSGRIDLPLLKVEYQNGSHIEPADAKNKEAQRAVTEYEVKDFAARKLALVELYPLTGRMHQLRVHCAAMKAPILGDKKYNEEMPFMEGFSQKLHLHARQLDMPHPAGGRLIIEASLPTHMKETFEQLGFVIPSEKKAIRTKK